MNTYRKECRKAWINDQYNGLTRREGFFLEKECLEKLNSKFDCLCSVQCEHFPKIISCDQCNYIFTLSNCGTDLHEYKLLVKTNKIKPITIKNMEEQIDCIIYNLKKCKIQHFDPKTRNICINNQGIISLIDFDVAAIGDKYRSIKLKANANAYSKGDYYIKFKKQLISTISNIIK